jgi:5-methyltetrahydropteroyltriglutamate--homocysteine methyltransferase
VQTKAQTPRVKGKIGFSNTHPFIEHFKFVKAHTKVAPKMTIPSPTVMHFRLEPGAVGSKVYPHRDDIFEDLAEAYRQAIKDFYDAGCRYLQFDDTAWAYLCSKEEMAKAKARGLNADTLAHDYTRILNASLEGKPSDMAITTHVCRGNFRSTWIASGGYEPVAEALFGAVNFDGYFLEYDTERAGGFEPLRFVPKGNKQIVLGLVTSKSGTLERRTTSSAASTRQASSSRSTSAACHRSAGSPRPRTATSSPRISNGRRCGRSSNSPMRYGESDGRRISLTEAARALPPRSGESQKKRPQGRKCSA